MNACDARYLEAGTEVVINRPEMVHRADGLKKGVSGTIKYISPVPFHIAEVEVAGVVWRLWPSEYEVADD